MSKRAEPAIRLARPEEREALEALQWRASLANETDRPDLEGELDGLFVEPDLWRSGIGAVLVETVTHEARRKGLTLSVIANPAALGFYERCGFAVEGEAQTRFGPALRMSK